MNGMMLSMRWKWQKLFSYGQVVCFATAWAIGLLIARDHGTSAEVRSLRSFAATANLPGVQASLRP
jgi:hypothetical protein